MIMIGYSGLFIIALVCMIIGGVIYAMCRVSGDCSREEEMHSLGMCGKPKSRRPGPPPPQSPQKHESEELP